MWKKVSTASLHGAFALYDAFGYNDKATHALEAASGIEQIQRWINLKGRSC